MLLTNAFSLNMLASLDAIISVKTLSLGEAIELAKQATSVVGHTDTAAVFASQLGMPVPANRATVVLHTDDELLIGQYRGPRLPEGATTLPEGAEIAWCLLQVA